MKFGQPTTEASWNSDKVPNTD